MQNEIDLDAIEVLAKAAGDQPWQQGCMLSTHETRRWSAEQQRECERRESQMVFQGFTAADQGRTRQRVAIFEAPERAEFVAAANPMTVLAIISELKKLRQAQADSQAEITALSKNVIEMTREDFDATLNNLRRMGASIDGDNAYKRDLCDSIVGTLAFGAQDRCPPPEGHWAQQFWDMGRESSANTEDLISALELVTDCLSKALTGGEVSAARAGSALTTADELLAKQSR